jgi:hypothetical protein
MAEPEMEPLFDSRDDGAPPRCEVAFCVADARYRSTDSLGKPVYLCEFHRPLAPVLIRGNDLPDA